MSNSIDKYFSVIFRINIAHLLKKLQHKFQGGYVLYIRTYICREYLRGNPQTIRFEIQLVFKFHHNKVSSVIFLLGNVGSESFSVDLSDGIPLQTSSQRQPGLLSDQSPHCSLHLSFLSAVLFRESRVAGRARTYEDGGSRLWGVTTTFLF